MKVTVRSNKKNIETIQAIDALRGEEAPPCPPGTHQMVVVMSGKNDLVKVTMKKCAVCGEFEWSS